MGTTFQDLLTEAIRVALEGEQPDFLHLVQGRAELADQLKSALMDSLKLMPSSALPVMTPQRMEKTPGHRYATAASIASDLRAVAQARPVPLGVGNRIRRRLRQVWSHRRALWATLAVVLLSMAFLLALVLGRQRVIKRAKARELLRDAQARRAHRRPDWRHRG